ncbi:MAG: M48 family metallopeptidase [Pseudomonadales bacterium]|nr:M48 family metallopeptidase [Pseudomonadales bacterium]
MFKQSKISEKNTHQLQFDEISIELVRKRIKNVHLSVHPPLGAVRMSAPLRMPTEVLHVFAQSRLSWIRQQQRKVLAKEPVVPLQCISGEMHVVWGNSLQLRVIEKEGTPIVCQEASLLMLQVNPDTATDKREAVIDAWCREQIRLVLPDLLAKWEPVMGVRVEKCVVQKMKTRWGSCTPRKRSIRLNAELVRKPRECLEYILVHEMVHLLEPSHNARFKGFMDQFLPDWRLRRDILNR